MHAKRIGFWLGISAILVMLLTPPPGDMPPEAWRVASVLVLMAIWWITEAMPLAATALLPFLLFPLLGAGESKKVASDYYSPVIFLVFGGSLVALSIERAGLHRRIALAIVDCASKVATPRSVVLAFMCATAVISMFVSNTATAVIMIPVAVALLVAITPDDESKLQHSGFAAALVLGVAYAASIGGLGTLVGSPTNAIAVGLIEKTTGYRLDFAKWLVFGLPLVAISIPLAWFILIRVLGVPNTSLDRAAVDTAIGTTGPWTTAERRLVPIIISLTVLWMALPLLTKIPALKGLDDGMIAVAGGMFLLLVPDGIGGRLLVWSDTKRAPWDVLLLYGGGLALAEGITRSGLAKSIGEAMEIATGWPVWMLALLVTAIVVIVTEFASNVATASGFMPVIAGITVANGIEPALLVLPAAVAASWGFAMPAGTGANALALGTGYARLPHFLKAGLLLDLVGIPLIVLICFLAAHFIR